MALKTSLNQKLAMTQQMQLAVKILQMNSLNLEHYLTQEALENPLIELELPLQEEEYVPTSLKKLEWLDSVDDSNSFKYLLRPKEEQALLYEAATGETLQESLLLQLIDTDIPPQVEPVIRYIIENLDKNGYLVTSEMQILKELNCDTSLLQQALNTLQNMDPPGVGAADLRECLLIQARRLTRPNPVLISLIEKHLHDIAKKRPDKLAFEMGVSIEEFKKAREELLTLSPKPGNGFGEHSTAHYICPDLFVVRLADSFRVIFNDSCQPRVEINRCYQDLLKHADSETSAFIRGKLAETKNIIPSINQRKVTVLSCAQAVLHRQTAFFKHGPGHLSPMTMADVAVDLGLHMSTVSRAVDGKYIQSQWGIQCLSDFFSRSVSKTSEQASQDMALVQIKLIIAKEDPYNPLSDQKIAQQLEHAGITISRRTVAKYRDQAKISAASARRQF